MGKIVDVKNKNLRGDSVEWRDAWRSSWREEVIAHLLQRFEPVRDHGLLGPGELTKGLLHAVWHEAGIPAGVAVLH